MADVDILFGNEDVILTKFMDAAGVLRRKERDAMRKILERFEQKFPQLFFSIYVGAFDDIPNLRQFGFWLLNRAAYSDVGVDRPNENGVLLVLDVNGKTAAMSFGYAIMPYLDEDTTFDALSAAHPFLLQGEYLKAFRVVLTKIENTLKKGWHKARKDPESFFAASGQFPRKKDQILKPIREGNQETQAEKEKEEVAE
ncbi:MAG: TPM domain-containing protein [Akkermansiaceae bacterium]